MTPQASTHDHDIDRMRQHEADHNQSLQTDSSVPWHLCHVFLLMRIIRELLNRVELTADHGHNLRPKFTKPTNLDQESTCRQLPHTVWVKKSPPMVFWHFFPNGWEFLINFLHNYYTFLSTLHCVSKKGPTLKRYSSKLYGSILMIFGRNIQKSLE